MLIFFGKKVYFILNLGNLTTCVKVPLFWEGDKNLRNLPHSFDIYLLNVKTMWNIAQTFVAFSEKLNFTGSPKIICFLKFDFWHTEICKINLVWREFWNCDMWTFLTLQLVLIESMMRAIYGPICKTMMIYLTPIVSRLKTKWYKLQTYRKLALNSQLETYQILTMIRCSFCVCLISLLLKFQGH